MNPTHGTSRNPITSLLVLLLIPVASAVADTAAVGPLPATFFGELPCASCPGIQTTVTLRPDGAFLSRSVYLEAEEGTDRAFHDLGRWSLSDDGRALTLRGGTEAPRRFAVEGPDRIRMLNNLGEEIESELDYGLGRVAHDPIEEPMRLRGMYVYFADAARFGECLTGLDRPVAFEKDSIALERAYLDARREPMERLMVTFEGHLAQRPAMEGDGTEEVFVVDSFDEVWPDLICEPSKPDVTLTNTYWRLVELDGMTVEVADGQREPHIQLRSDGSQVGGSGGCNRLSGRYQLDGTRLRFGPLATTRMACPEGMDQERALLTALDDAVAYLVTGETLQIWGEDGDVSATFAATYF
jgi:copper homeostasis protein (lipoprotein)